MKSALRGREGKRAELQIRECEENKLSKLAICVLYLVADIWEILYYIHISVITTINHNQKTLETTDLKNKNTYLIQIILIQYNTKE